MKYFILAILLFIIPCHAKCITYVTAGNVSGVWTLANSPYYVQGHIGVPVNKVLVIEAGVTVVFQGHYELEVNGQLLCLGTEKNSIHFTATSEWWGIRFENGYYSQDSSIFQYCNIQKGNASGASALSLGGGIYLKDFSKVRIDHCTISNNSATHGGGIYCENANPVISNCVISNNNGGGIYSVNSAPIFFNNTITQNGMQVESINNPLSLPVTDH